MYELGVVLDADRAEVDRGKITPNQVFAELHREFFPGLRNDFPNVLVSAEGEQREQNDMLESIRRGIGLSLLVIFAMLAVPLKSYLQPGIIMLAIPFGVAGAVWAHLFLGMTITFMSLIGVMDFSSSMGVSPAKVVREVMRIGRNRTLAAS